MAGFPQSKARKGGVVSRWYLHRGDDLKAFKASIPSLQVAASFACSVASLSRSPAFQLPGHHHLHDEVLADHQFDWGGLSTCTAAHAQCLLTPSPSQNLQESPPSKNLGFEHRVAWRFVSSMAFWQLLVLATNPCSFLWC